MHRFFLTSDSLKPNQTVDLSPLAPQLHDVLRLQPGAQITLLDNSSDEFVTEITQLERKRAMGVILSQQRCRAEPTLHLTLYQCSLKADKFEWVLQKCTELGVSRFVPIISERSIVRPTAALLKKYVRWHEILREAAEQCGRGKIPELAEPMNFADAVKGASGERLLAWEEARQGDKGTRREGEMMIPHSAPHTPHLSLLIGPEGGITQPEAELAQTHGWQSISLGRRILRAETAAVAAVAVIMSTDTEGD